MSESRTLVDKWLDWIKNNRIAAAVIVMSVVLSGVAEFRKNITDIFASNPDSIARRAYLSVDGVRVLRHTDEDGQVSFEINLSNSGDTPATIEAGALRLFVLASSRDLPQPSAPFLLKDELKDIGHHGHSLDVPAKGKAVLATFLCFCLDSESGQGDAVLLGYLEFKDAFGDRHTIRWGWVVDLTDAYLVDGLPSNVGAFTTKEAVDGETVQKILRSMTY